MYEIRNAWKRYVLRKDSSVDVRAYTFCVLDQLATALHRRDVFTKPSWRYADPRANLLGESEWDAMRPECPSPASWRLGSKVPRSRRMQRQLINPADPDSSILQEFWVVT